MPVPLPVAEDTDLRPPGAEEAFATAEAIGAVVAPAGGRTPVQRVLLEALYSAMTGAMAERAGGPYDGFGAAVAAAAG